MDVHFGLLCFASRHSPFAVAQAGDLQGLTHGVMCLNGSNMVNHGAIRESCNLNSLELDVQFPYI